MRRQSPARPRTAWRIWDGRQRLARSLAGVQCRRFARRRLLASPRHRIPRARPASGQVGDGPGVVVAGRQRTLPRLAILHAHEDTRSWRAPMARNRRPRSCSSASPPSVRSPRTLHYTTLHYTRTRAGGHLPRSAPALLPGRAHGGVIARWCIQCARPAGQRIARRAKYDMTKISTAVRRLACLPAGFCNCILPGSGLRAEHPILLPPRHSTGSEFVGRGVWLGAAGTSVFTAAPWWRP